VLDVASLAKPLERALVPCALGWIFGIGEVSAPSPDQRITALIDIEQVIFTRVGRTGKKVGFLATEAGFAELPKNLRRCAERRGA
jgi:hypothetical protein